ncbi:hypothetical protein NP493_318g03022 [Ridgeia piscesae]|uniref:Uncharacterized protein n=1 Tax=Ridgeia piscesae TaxID=27915 RepID=A0AAD9L4C6_RIDPI|nr:hypothetical protein NP493_318g03022 [Ridgeia piscesae]
MPSTLPKNIKTLERIQRQGCQILEPGTVTQLLKDFQWDILQPKI